MSVTNGTAAARRLTKLTCQVKNLYLKTCLNKSYFSNVYKHTTCFKRPLNVNTAILMALVTAGS